MRTIAIVLTVSVVLLSVPQVVSAQSHLPEISGAYAWEAQGDGRLPFGWVISPTLPLTSWLAVAGEVAGQYDFYTIPDVAGATYRGQTFAFSNHTFALGPRVAVAVMPRATVFAQGLFGTFRIAGDPFRPVGWSHWALVIQPGAGA